jgi:hypothetical protein
VSIKEVGKVLALFVFFFASLPALLRFLFNMKALRFVRSGRSEPKKTKKRMFASNYSPACL